MKHLGLSIVLGVCVAFITAPFITQIRTEFYPVVTDMRVVEAKVTPEFTEAHIVGNKVRSCGKLLAISADTIQRRITHVAFLDDVLTDGTFKQPDENEIGTNVDFGWWRFRPGVSGDVVVRVYHQCPEGLVETKFSLNIPNKE